MVRKKISKELSASCKRQQDGKREVARNGQKYLQNTAKIGRAKRKQKPGGI